MKTQKKSFCSSINLNFSTFERILTVFHKEFSLLLANFLHVRRYQQGNFDRDRLDHRMISLEQQYDQERREQLLLLVQMKDDLSMMCINQLAIDVTQEERSYHRQLKTKSLVFQIKQREFTSIEKFL